MMDAIDRVVELWDRERPELDTEPMAIMGRIFRITKYLESAVGEVHKRYDLKMGEFDVVATLRRSGAPYRLTPSELLGSLMLTSGAMTNRLDKLEQKGLILRQHSKEDRRSVTVELTEHGLVTVNKLIEEHVAIQHALLKNLSKPQKQALNAVLKEWLGQFE